MGYVNIDIKVRYEDVDKKNNLTLKGFLKYLVDTAAKHSNNAGYGLNNIPNTKVAWLILNWRVQIFRYPKTSEMIHITTWARSMSKLYSYRDFEVFDDFGNRIAIASSKWVLVNFYTKSIAKISQEIIDSYGPIEKMIFDKEIEKINEPKEDYTNRFDYTILRRDLDTNNHVNNLNYLDFAIEALPENVYENMEFKNISVLYKKQCLIGDKITCLYTINNINEHVIVIKSNDLQTLHSIVILS